MVVRIGGDWDIMHTPFWGTHHVALIIQQSKVDYGINYNSAQENILTVCSML